MSLNSKKSWHPGKAINRAKVAKLEEEQKAREAQIKQIRANYEEERELTRLKEQAQGSSSKSQQSWIHENSKLKGVVTNDRDMQKKEPVSIYDSRLNAGIKNKIDSQKAAIDPLAEILKRSKSPKTTTTTDRVQKPRKSDTRYKSIER